MQVGEQPNAELQSTHDVVIKVHAAALNPVCAGGSFFGENARIQRTN